MNTIPELIKTIDKDFQAQKFDRFIHDVTFPNFKKIKPLTKVEFNFPLTVLVGANGGGKSTILQALWGMPQGYSTNRFWFSTPIDPINEELAGKPNIPRYWYTHYIKEINQKVETRKVKGRKSNGYWEPSRPSTNDGMQKMPNDAGNGKIFMSDSGDRWTPVNRSVHYINTKSETSAFDRFFYHTELTKINEKQDFFIRRTAKLDKALRLGYKAVNIGQGTFFIESISIPVAHLEIINKILGKKYISAKKVLHDLYDKNKSPSVIFETDARTYSESFAGSGELAIVNLVLRVEALKEFDLLLIDEPETSLHPGAQKELLRYLLQKTKDKYLQIVIATHSPTIIDFLPECALIVLDDTLDGAAINTKATKSTAFHRLGQPDPNKVTIVAEDRLLQAYLERVSELLEPETRNRIAITAAVTGASEMLSHQVPAYIASNSKLIMVLDGDQKKFLSLISPDPDSLSPQQLDAIISKLKMECHVTVVGSAPDIPAYFAWCKKYILLIEQVCAEQIFLELLNPVSSDETFTNQEYKKKVRQALSKRGDEGGADSQYVLFKSLLGEAMRKEKNGIVALKLKAFSAELENAISRLS
jgi:predicted ATPase